MDFIRNFIKGPLPESATTTIEETDFDEWDGNDGDDSANAVFIDSELIKKHKEEMENWDDSTTP